MTSAQPSVCQSVLLADDTVLWMACVIKTLWNGCCAFQIVVCTSVDMASGRNYVHIVHCCSLVQKPVSSVAPTSVQHQKPSPIYQTSSTKIHPVQPQTLSSTPQVMQLLAVLTDRMYGTYWDSEWQLLYKVTFEELIFKNAKNVCLWQDLNCDYVTLMDGQVLWRTAELRTYRPVSSWHLLQHLYNSCVELWAGGSISCSWLSSC